MILLMILPAVLWLLYWRLKALIFHVKHYKAMISKGYKYEAAHTRQNIFHKALEMLLIIVAYNALV